MYGFRPRATRRTRNRADGDGAGLGDACDPCPQDPENLEADGDGACDGDDNCPEDPSADQMDGDGDGDSCDETFGPFGVRVEPGNARALAGDSVALTFAVDNGPPRPARWSCGSR